MDARWKMFYFTYQILDSEQENFIVCPQLFIDWFFQELKSEAKNDRDIEQKC